MSAPQEISFELDGIGEITMTGVGPWSCSSVGATVDVRDSKGAVANPTVVQRWSTVTKPNRNVVFAKRATTEAVIAKANELLEAAGE